MTRFARIPEAAVMDGRLNATQLRVLMALWLHADKDDQCHPSRQRISELTGLLVNNISRTTAELERLGWLSKSGNGGRSRATRYQLHQTINGINTDTLNKPVNGIKSETVSNPKRYQLRVINGISGDTRKEHTTRTEKATPPIPPLPDRFDDFWKAWPSGYKTGRKVCVTKWRSMKLDRIADQIIADVKQRQELDDRWLRGFIPNPSTYLNQERWNDDYRKPTPNSGQPRKLSAAERAEQSEREFIAEQRRKAAAQHHGPAVDPHEPDQRQSLDGEFWRSGEDRGPADRRDGADRNGGSVGGGSGGFDSGGHQAGGRRNGARGIAAHHATGVQAGVFAAAAQRTDPTMPDGRRAESAAAAATEQGQGREAYPDDPRLAAIWNAGGQRWN